MSVNGYQVVLSGPECLLRSGMTPYWNIDFVNLLRAVNRSRTVDEILFPDPIQDSSGKTVSFAFTDTEGNDVLKKSSSLRDKSIPRCCLKKLQAAIDLMHIWADDPRVPTEKREFCRQFRLPDPKKDPDAYRMSGGLFSCKLHVLWGYEKAGSKAFLPKSRISEKWDDAASREDIVTMCQGGILRRVFRLRNIFFAVLVAVGVYMLCCLPVECPVHGCLVGNGAYNYFNIDKCCPKRCVLTGCNRHLDDKEKCNAHKCTVCGKMMPTSNGQNGVCDDCFWDIK